MRITSTALEAALLGEKTVLLDGDVEFAPGYAGTSAALGVAREPRQSVVTGMHKGRGYQTDSISAFTFKQ